MSNFKDIKEGVVFVFEESPRHPKLRTAYGYIDMRGCIGVDTKGVVDIRTECIHQVDSLAEPLRVLSQNELQSMFNLKDWEVFNWIYSLNTVAP